MKKYFYLCFFVLITLMGSSCAYLKKNIYLPPRMQEKAPEKPPVYPAPTKEETIPPRPARQEVFEREKRKIAKKYIEQQITKGDENLKKGNYKQAEKDYLTIFFIDPKNVTALNRLRSIPIIKRKKRAIQKPSEEIIKAKGDITYTVVPGDTLAIIAQKFYGDYKKYTILAEANKIRAPYTLKEGQTIIIPKDYKTIDLNEIKKKGEKCFDDKDFKCAIETFNLYLSVKSDSDEIKKHLKEGYYEEISKNYNQNNFTEASSLIKDLRQSSAKYEIDLMNISNYIEEIENNIQSLANESGQKIKAEKFKQEAEKLQSKKMLAKAREKFVAALSILEDIEQIDVTKLINDVNDKISLIDSSRRKETAIIIKDEALKLLDEEKYEDASIKLQKAANLDHKNKEIQEYSQKANKIAGLISKAQKESTQDPELSFSYYKQANTFALDEFKKKSLRVEKAMIKTIPKLKVVAENKLAAEDPCGSLKILNMIIKSDKEIDIPPYIKEELKEVYQKTSSLKQALDIKCVDINH